ncbi:MAG: hypothetical protein WBK48_10670 [Dethiobacteria bacterium]|jgi:hypothetical protein|nr:hypothetical protein [Bacillota bacterium]HOP69999.1 hypothetical protein [Bacillota bacterium]HQD06859.1 hypothetical protein [Bacillota bacterium]
MIANPYENVDWSSCGRYKANLHTHTFLSDGRISVRQAIDLYRDYGYRILALTDHSSVTLRTTWPWSRWRRDPAATGMMAVQGNEIGFRYVRCGSRTLIAQDHVLSYFVGYKAALLWPHHTQEDFIRIIGERGGLAVFAHPKEYERFRAPEYYISLFRQYPHLAGMELFTRHSSGEALWDRLLSELMPRRPVWGFANDDLHSLKQFGRCFNIFLLDPGTIDSWENPAVLRQAMERGQFYFSWVEDPSWVKNSSVDPPPAIKSIEVGEGYIRIEAEGAVEPPEWIVDGGRVLFRGDTFRCPSEDQPFTYVRVRLTGRNGKTYTNPFGLLKAPGTT